MRLIRSLICFNHSNLSKVRFFVKKNRIAHYWEISKWWKKFSFRLDN
jgi:hypothetical protein